MSDVENYILLIFKKLNLDREPFPLIIVASNINKKMSPNMLRVQSYAFFLKMKTQMLFFDKRAMLVTSDE